MKKISLKITALLLGWMSFSALAEQTVDIEIRGIKGERAIRNTDMNEIYKVKSIRLPSREGAFLTGIVRDFRIYARPQFFLFKSI